VSEWRIQAISNNPSSRPVCYYYCRQCEVVAGTAWRRQRAGPPCGRDGHLQAAQEVVTRRRHGSALLPPVRRGAFVGRRRGRRRADRGGRPELPGDAVAVAGGRHGGWAAGRNVVQLATRPAHLASGGTRRRRRRRRRRFAVAARRSAGNSQQVRRRTRPIHVCGKRIV